MAVRRSFNRSGIRSTRRDTSWFDLPLTNVLVASNAAALVLSLTAAELAKRPFTIIRTQLTCHLGSDQLIADELQAMAVGMCVVSDQASAIGVTAVPTPDTDSASDLWFLHRYLVTSFFFNSAVGFDANGGKMVHIDSKGARKVNDSEDVILAVETGAISSGVSFTLGGRLLIKEH